MMNILFAIVVKYKIFKSSKPFFFFTSVLLCCFLNSCTSQSASFTKIEYASFKIIKSKTDSKDSIFIGLYSIIDNKGLVKVLNDDDYHDTLKFYTHQLNNDQLSKLKTVFNPLKKLDTYFVTKKLADNEFYAGVYRLFIVSYHDGQRDSLCFVEPFMSDEFNSVYKMLDNDAFYGENVKPYNPFKISENFKYAVWLNYKKSIYLPEVKALPSFKMEDH